MDEMRVQPAAGLGKLPHEHRRLAKAAEPVAAEIARQVLQELAESGPEAGGAKAFEQAAQHAQRLLVQQDQDERGASRIDRELLPREIGGERHIRRFTTGLVSRG